MKYLGGALVLGYAVLHFMGLDPWPDDERGKLPQGRRGPGSAMLWRDGFMGGK